MVQLTITMRPFLVLFAGVVCSSIGYEAGHVATTGERRTDAWCDDIERFKDRA